MESSITIVNSQEAFDRFFPVLMWDCAYVKESHFVNAQWKAPSGTAFTETPILRVLIMLPCELANQALEIVAYDVSHYSMAEWLDDCKPTGNIKRRQAEVAFGPVSIKAACIGFRWVDNIASERNPFYTQEGYFDEQGRIVEPYNVDWTSELDVTADKTT